jgi:hypothetical protein
MGELGTKSSGLDSLVWLAIIAAIGLSAWLIIPNFIRSRATSSQNGCVNNLRQIDGTKNEWAVENGKTNGSVVIANQLTNYLYRGILPKCPQGGIYIIGKIGENPTCSLATNGFPWHKLP